MSAARYLLLIGLAGAISFAADGKADAKADPKAVKPQGSPLSPRFQQVRERIDALYRYRKDGAAKYDPRENPFRAAGPAIVASTATPGGAPGEVSPEQVEPDGDQATLQKAVSGFRIGGVLEIGGVSHVAINGKSYRKSDIIQAQVQGQLVLVRLREISKRNITLALNEAEVVVKLP